MEAQVKLIGMDQLKIDFKRMRGFQISAALKRASIFMVGSTQEGYKKETSPLGKKWAPLAARTVAKRGTSHPILQDSGEMHRSLFWRRETGLRFVVKYRTTHPKKKPLWTHEGTSRMPDRKHMGFANFKRLGRYNDPDSIMHILDSEFVKETRIWPGGSRGDGLGEGRAII